MDPYSKAEFNKSYMSTRGTTSMNTMFIEDHSELRVTKTQRGVTVHIGGSTMTFLCKSDETFARLLYELACVESATNTPAI